MKDTRNNADLRERISAGKLDAANKRGRLVEPELLAGVKEKNSLIKLGLEALIARESSKRLAKIGGTEKNLQMIPRRRMDGNNEK